MKELKVGDVIYRYEYGNLTEKKTIDRLTPKRAFAGHNEFKKEYEHTRLSEIGRGSFNHHSFYISTPDNDAIWQLQELRNKAQPLVRSLTKYTADQLTKLIEILSN